MDEMPGMIRPDLQALPQVKDRIFSPHMRGVIPKGAGQGRADGSFPRIRGGDPMCTYSATEHGFFSPHTRG